MSDKTGIEGAPNQSNIVALCKPCRTKRDAAADWVEMQGGLDEVKHHYAFVVEQMASRLGVERVEDEPEHVTVGKIIDELDKRLMPPDMEWMRFGDGKRVEFGDSWLDGVGDPHVLHAVEFRDREAAEMGARVIMRGRTYSNDDSIEYNLWPGARVKRPEPEVRGSDGLPIKAGETVYHFFSGNKYTVKCIVGKDLFFEECPSGLCDPSAYTHTQPETQQRIDDDATRDPTTYCNDVLGWDAHNVVRYSDDAAQIEAMVFDLLRRQRELDAKTTGGE